MEQVEMANAVEEALNSLMAAREDAAREFSVAQAKLGQLDQAIAHLKDTVMVVDPQNLPKRQDYAGLGILQAAEKWLQEVGGAARTEEIAKEILARGVATRSKRFVPTVYATLRNSAKFERHDDKWSLKKQRGER